MPTVLRPMMSIILPLLACMAAPPLKAEDWGIVTSEAITAAGHEFCTLFLAGWRDKPGSEQYTLAIRERPFARRGNLIWVDAGQRRLLQLQLPPGRGALKALADSAVDSAWDSVRERDRERWLLVDADLAADEF
jgi:curli production assembly/transport component CsgE